MILLFFSVCQHCHMHMDIATVTEITGQQHQYPAAFKCVEESPVDDAVLSPYNMYYPSVDMRYIFCGQIVHHEPQGFHSLNLSTDWTKCAVAHQCKFFSNQNAYCKDVYILTRANERSFEKKNLREQHVAIATNTRPACSTIPVFVLHL